MHGLTVCVKATAFHKAAGDAEGVLELGVLDFLGLGHLVGVLVDGAPKLVGLREGLLVDLLLEEQVAVGAHLLLDLRLVVTLVGQHLLQLQTFHLKKGYHLNHHS